MSSSSLPARPRFSVIIPAFNSRSFIHRAIDSVLAQSFPAHELIVIDDGSTDGTADYIAETYGDRVRCCTIPNGGPSNARNHGAKLATGDWLAFLDSDDWWFPEKLQAQADALERAPHAGFSASGYILTEDGAEIPYPLLPANAEELAKALLVRTTILLSTVAVRRDWFLELGGFRHDLWGGEDRELWARLAIRGEVAIHRDPLVYKAHRPVSLSMDPFITLRDTTRVNEIVLQTLRPRLQLDPVRVFLLRRKAAALVQFQVSNLFTARGDRTAARQHLLKSFQTWPFSVRTAKRMGRVLLGH